MRDHPEYSLVGFACGSFFIGEVNDRSQRHGQGVCFHPDGTVETELLVDSLDATNSGRWINGRLNGRATQLYLGGGRYHGSFMSSVRHGVGVLS